MTKSPAELITDKGVSPIAEATKAQPVTVRMWRYRNQIPRSVWPELVRAFPDLTLEKLVKLEANAKAAAERAA